MRVSYLLACTGIGLLAACSGGGGGSSQESNQFCHAVGQNGSSCTGCVQVSDQGNTFDGHLDTFATMTGGGSGTFAGITRTQPATSVAGVYFKPGVGSTVSVSITTYLDGVQKDTSATSTHSGSGAQSCTGGMDCRSNGGEAFIGVPTTMDYDEIRANVNNTGTDASEIHEICVY